MKPLNFENEVGEVGTNMPMYGHTHEKQTWMHTHASTLILNTHMQAHMHMYAHNTYI